MKAFVSYSVSDNNEFILTLLSSKLREKKFVINTSQNFYNNILDYNTMNEINETHLFIGIITGFGNERNRVLEEWRYAVSRNIPNLLLIEDTVPVQQTFTGNYIRFNRINPQRAINEINRRMTTPVTTSTTKNSDDIVPWVLGGAALLAVLALLSGSKK
jgi:hypothetical protein